MAFSVYYAFISYRVVFKHLSDRTPTPANLRTHKESITSYVFSFSAEWSRLSLALRQYNDAATCYADAK